MSEGGRPLTPRSTTGRHWAARPTEPAEPVPDPDDVPSQLPGQRHASAGSPEPADPPDGPTAVRPGSGPGEPTADAPERDIAAPAGPATPTAEAPEQATAGGPGPTPSRPTTDPAKRPASRPTRDGAAPTAGAIPLGLPAPAGDRAPTTGARPDSDPTPAGKRAPTTGDATPLPRQAPTGQRATPAPRAGATRPGPARGRAVARSSPAGERSAPEPMAGVEPGRMEGRGGEESGPARKDPGPDEAGWPAEVPRWRRRWQAAGAALSRPPQPTPVPAAFATPVRLGARQRYRLALRASDRAYHLESMVRSAPSDRCRVIAVVSPKGGPGKTTITFLLGTLLAELRRDPVLALDANPDLGDLTLKLGGEDGTDAAVVDELADWLDRNPGAAPAQVWSRLGVGPHGLRYVATPRPPASTLGRMVGVADFQLYLGLIGRLRDYAGIIVVDCGTGLLDPPVQAALDAADQILLVTDSSATTARQVVAAATLLPEATPTWLVANKIPPRGSRVDLAQVVAAIPRLRGMTVVPDPGDDHRAESLLTPAFRWSEAPEGWQQPIRELAARLAGDWAHGLLALPG